MSERLRRTAPKENFAAFSDSVSTIAKRDKDLTAPIGRAESVQEDRIDIPKRFADLAANQTERVRYVRNFA